MVKNVLAAGTLLGSLQRSPRPPAGLRAEEGEGKRSGGDEGK